MRVLGKGGGGTTYLAESVEDGARVALKEFPASADAQRLELMRREASVLRGRADERGNRAGLETRIPGGNATGARAGRPSTCDTGEVLPVEFVLHVE